VLTPSEEALETILHVRCSVPLEKFTRDKFKDAKLVPTYRVS
jgi:hypothetical protein